MRRNLLIAAVGLVALGIGAYFTRGQLGEAVTAIRSADPNWLSVAAAAFLAATVAAAGSWCCAVGLAGGDTSLIDSCARYGVGSFVNTFVPARAGDAVRIALFSKVVPHRQRIRTTGGAFAAIGAARALALITLVAAGWLARAVPLWPLLVLTGIVAVALVVSRLARTKESHFLDAFRALAEDRRGAARLIGWMLASTAARFLAASAICASLGVRGAFAAAIIILPALDLAGLFPVTPGNIGVTSGAIAVALKAHGLSMQDGLAAGIAFHAVETAVGLAFGTAAALWLAPALKLRERLPSPT